MRLPFLGRRQKELPVPRDFPYIELRGGDCTVLMIPSLGGKLAELWLGGRQWLWQSDLIPLAPGTDGASYVETADTGGWDECFPTVGACRIPGWVRGLGGTPLPDHGELWAQSPAIEVHTSGEGQGVTCRWSGLRLPYVFERTVRVDGGGIVHLGYAAMNTGSERLPFIWSSHPLFPLTPSTQIDLQEGTRLRVYARHGIELGELRSEHRWPFVRAGARACDFRIPADVAKRYAAKLFLDATEGGAILREDDRELVMHWDAREIPHIGLWINHRGWTPFKGGEPCMNLALEPAIGAPDTLDDALGDWKSASWLEPGDVRRWHLMLEGRGVTTSP